MCHQGLEQDSHHVWTDASGQCECGGHVPSVPVMATTAVVPLIKTRAQQLQDESILLQELLPIVLACAVQGQDWQGSWVVVCCDNMGAVAVVNLGYS